LSTESADAFESVGEGWSEALREVPDASRGFDAQRSDADAVGVVVQSSNADRMRKHRA